jgi:hypothetical protein
MTSEAFDDIYDRINELIAREKNLRAELANVRYERARLKSQLNFSDLSKPKWVADLPREFWYPSFYTSKVINGLHPNLEYRNVPPDIEDWQRSSGAKEVIINLALGIGVVIIALQLFFFLL